MNSKISPPSELFLHGAGRDLDALTAIAAFRAEAEDMCTEIYKHYEPELAKQMGLDAEDCEPHGENSPEERWAEVGIKRHAQRTCYFYLYLAWGEDERNVNGVIAAIALGLYTRRLRDEIYEAFRRESPGCRVEKFDTYSLVLSQGLKDLISVRDALDALVLEWLGYCKSTGGLKLRERNIT